MNKHLRYNNNIIVSNDVIIDGIDPIFDPSAHQNFSGIVKDGYYYVDDIDTDDDGEYLDLRGNDNYESILYRFNISKKTAPRPINKLNLKIGNFYILGKNINYAPYIKDWSLLEHNAEYYYNNKNYYKKYLNTDTYYWYLYDMPLKMIGIKEDYVMVKGKDDKTYVFPHWFLYESNMAKNMYTPKKIRRFIDF